MIRRQKARQITELMLRGALTAAALTVTGFAFTLVA